MKRLSLPTVAATLALTLLFSGFQALESWSANKLGGREFRFVFALLDGLIYWVLFLGFIPAVRFFTARFPLGGLRSAGHSLVHLAAAPGLAGAHCLLAPAFFSLTQGGGFSPRWMLRNLPFVVLKDFYIGLLIYGLLLALFHALDWQERSRQEQFAKLRAETQLAEAQLEALRMQIHPHFLFNSLHAISGLQLIDPRAAQRMTARLGEFLRITLNSARTQTVPLREELRFAECYLDIERIRLGPRLEVVTDVPASLLDVPVPHLILQPLVENAVRHGICAATSGGRIAIRARLRFGELILEVADTGPGIAEGAADAGLGLSNVEGRLAALYRGRAALEVSNPASGGALAAIRIPIPQEEPVVIADPLPCS